MRPATLFALCLLELATAVPVVINASQVDLGYAKYQGARLPNGIDQFLGMRYAAPPTGDRRFRLPAAPLNTTGVIQAKEHGPLCYGVTNPSLPAVPFPYSEDCLFIDVYAPSHASRNSHSGLPVMLWIQGGGFVQLYNPNYNGAGLIEASRGNAIIVTFNYRVGPYGFLANDELKSEGNLNIGLHDQRAAMHWVEQHIAQFGGDPRKVTLFGTSVGGGSVLLQTLAYGGQAPRQDAIAWAACMAESAYMPSTYTVDQQAFHYQDLLRATNCTTLECLRSAPIDFLQAANNAVAFLGRNETALFGYGPVIDGDLLPDYPRNLLRSGRFFKDKPLIIGNSITEGTIFTPQANTTADVNTFLQAQYPRLSNASLQRLNDVYLDTPTTFPNVTKSQSPLFYRAAEMLGDVSFICSSLTFAQNLSSAGVPVHVFADSIMDPVEVAAGLITPHTWEVQAVWGPQYATQYVALPGANSYNVGGVNAGIVPVVQGYWTSFAQTSGNPNVLRQVGAPIWEEYGRGRVLNLRTNQTRMESVGQEKLRKCAVWAELAHEIGQ